MKLRIATIVLDGMPWIAHHLPIFNQLKCDWEWHVAEGVSMPVNDTAWVKGIKPRLSNDGTSEYLNSIAMHPRVKIIRKPEWAGKTEQINACLGGVSRGDIVMQIDSDEIWSHRQIDTLIRQFKVSQQNAASFWCRYFVGPNIVVVNRENYSQHSAWEWRRAWIAGDGFQFVKHEPPEVQGAVYMPNNHTESIGLVFDHYAYALEKQVAFKEEYYGYGTAVAQWRKLQANTKWPARLADYFPWVTDNALVDRLYK